MVFLFQFNILCENFIKIGPIIKKIPKFCDDPLKGIDPIITPNLSQKLQKMIFAEKASSGMEEMCPKILGGY